MKKPNLGKYNKKVKKAAITIGVVILVLFFFAGISSSIIRTNVGVDNFENNYSSVSTFTRRILRDDLKKIAELNSGKKDFKAKFALREDGSATSTTNEETKEGYGSFFVDSDLLQISLYVQLNWGSSFSSSSQVFDVRIECAEKDYWKYDSNHCVTPELDESAMGLEYENLNILKTYISDNTNFNDMRSMSLAYLKTIDPVAESILVQPKTVQGLGDNIGVEVVVDFEDSYWLSMNESGIVTITKNNIELWRYDNAQFAQAKHYRSLIGSYLPVELKTENGTDYALRWSGDNKLKINSDKCANGDTNAKLIEGAKEWLGSQGFTASDFEITTINSCAE